MTMQNPIDVVVVGAGPAGLAAALALSQAGLSVRIADTSPEASRQASSGRSAALLSRTVSLLKRLDVWDALRQKAAPLRALQFIDDTGRLLRAPDAVFRASEIGEDAFGSNVLNVDLSESLARALADRGIRIDTPGPVQETSPGADAITVTFADGTHVTATMAVAADGKNSALRRGAALKTLAWSYPQTAVATSFDHELPHRDVCIEIHRRAGPFTLVPLPGNRSSLVWVETEAEADRLAALDDSAFCREVERVSRFALGSVSPPAPRARFPLSSLVVRSYGCDRVAVVGEAAHVTPPIGAQGLNLGFRDVEDLAACLVEARAAGEDIGAPSVLATYSSRRRSDVLTRTAGVDLLNRSLMQDFLPLSLGRAASLWALSASGRLRRQFMRWGIAPDAVQERAVR
jgi:2-octaprenyl-6-methoxyphenol hydroxylase